MLSPRRFSSRALRHAATGCIALAVALASAGTSYADVFSVAPKDSLGVLRVRNLAATSKKLGDFAKKLNLVAMKPELADPMAALKTEFKVSEGLKEDGDVGLILLPAAQWPDMSAAQPGGKEPQPAIVVLIPVTDYAKFVSGIEGATTEGDITVFKQDENTFMAHWGDYAAISPKKEYLAGKGEGVKVNAFTAKEMEAKDAVLWANIAAMKAVFGPKLAEHKDKWLAEVDDQMSKDAERAKYSPVAKAAVTQLIKVADTFLSEAQGATFSFDVSGEALRTTVAAEFAPDSYLGKLVTTLKGSDRSLTAGLPGGAYIYFGGMNANGPAAYKLIQDIATPILDEYKKVDPANSESVAKFMALLDQSSKSTKSVSFGVIAPHGTLGQDPLLQMLYVAKGDAKAMMEKYDQDTANLTNKLMEASGQGGIVYTYKKADKTLDGVTFDSLIGLPKENPQTVEEGQMAFAMNLMYGPSGAVSYFGAVDDNTLVGTLCLTDAAMSKLIAAAKADSDDLAASAPIAATTKALPQNPIGLFYFSVDELMKTANNYMGQQGVPITLPVPDALSPFGFAIDTEGTTLRIDSYLPADTLKAISDAVQSTMGPPAGGGPGNNRGPRRRPRPAPAPAPAQ
jgi:hypothetical protein